MKHPAIKASCTALALALSGLAGSALAANFQTLDLSSSANMNLQEKNALFPTGDFLTRFAVPFSIASSPKNAWGSGDGVEASCFCNDGLWQTTLPVNLSGLKTIYTLAGSNWAGSGSNMTITGVFDNGQRAVWTFTDGQQLRDWNLYPAFTTTINGTNTNEVLRVSPPLPAWDGNPDVLDMQTLAIPASLQGAKLQELIVTDLRQSLVHSGFIAGITVSGLGPLTPALQATVVPEPEVPMLVLAGLACVWRRALKAKAKAIA